eukprot:g8710.t1
MQPPSKKPAFNFSFGGAPAAGATAAPSTPTAAPAAPTFGAASTVFGGTAPAAPAAPAVGGFSFGGSTAATTTAPATGGFSFGATKPAAPAAPAAGGFSFGSTAPAATAAAPAWGATPAAPVAFGATTAAQPQAQSSLGAVDPRLNPQGTAAYGVLTQSVVSAGQEPTQPNRGWFSDPRMGGTEVIGRAPTPGGALSTIRDIASCYDRHSMMCPFKHVLSISLSL